jgi:hypothetical protein
MKIYFYLKGDWTPYEYDGDEELAEKCIKQFQEDGTIPMSNSAKVFFLDIVDSHGRERFFINKK